MKKGRLILISLTLLLSALACKQPASRFPTTATPTIDLPTTTATEELPQETATPDIDSTVVVEPTAESDFSIIDTTYNCNKHSDNKCVVVDDIVVNIEHTDDYATGRTEPEKPSSGDNRVSWDNDILVKGTSVTLHRCYAGSYTYNGTTYRGYVSVQTADSLLFVWIHSGVLEPNPCENLTPSDTVSTVAAPTASPEKASATEVVSEAMHNQAVYYENGSRNKPYIALGIDLCQQVETDPDRFPDMEIYNYLVDNQIPATWFISGLFAQANPDYVKALAQHDFFEIANHSWDHPNNQIALFNNDPAAFDEQILRTQELLSSLTGKTPDKYRPPAGNGFGYNTFGIKASNGWDSGIATRLNNLGLKPVTWDVISGDPKYYTESGWVVPSTDQIVNNVLSTVQNGSIFVMHGNGQGVNTANALQYLVPHLQNKGYTFVTVDQLDLVEKTMP